ncbi:hypothetical protein [Amycolatopsis sp. lyj-23]|uniref:hypothetical protein n=1 Tax=Amycolatopsis sp. lyj-23 TaxID=2789283 RepID=UPI003979CD7A
MRTENLSERWSVDALGAAVTAACGHRDVCGAVYGVADRSVKRNRVELSQFEQRDRAQVEEFGFDPRLSIAIRRSHDDISSSAT